MPPIRILPAHTINRIAAGEVIERPAAAVKELVENALDAGATRIAVALDGGGIDRIEVTDDGCGMDAASLALSVLRHATSKLIDDDLVRIATLGFRGEALPSIGAAARLAITSRPRDAAHASEIRVEGGAVSDVAPDGGRAGHACGGARPVLRHPGAAQVPQVIRAPRRTTPRRRCGVWRWRRPSVAFRLESDGRVAFDLPPQAARRRGSRRCSARRRRRRWSRSPANAARLRITGHACSPAVTRATGAAQALTVNGRPVADPVLKVAVRVAYRDVIAAGRHPIVALWLDMPPDELDVNVHPAKTELRFRDVGAVRSLVIGSLRRALAGRRRHGAAGAAARAASGAFARLTRCRTGPVPLPGMAEAPLAFGAAPAARMLPAPEPRPEHPLGAPVAQVLDTYVIAVAGDGSLVLVDQHAAHERLTHEALREQMLDGGVRSQPLLLPAVVDMPPADAAAAAGARRRTVAAGPGDRGVRPRRGAGARAARRARRARTGAAAARPRR